VLLLPGESVPTSVSSELSAQFSDQLRSLDLGPAEEPRPHPFGGRDRWALPQDLAGFLIVKLLDLLEQSDEGDLRIRVRITAVIAAFEKDLMSEFLAEDVRQEMVCRRALDQYYANGEDGGDDGGIGGRSPPATS
jgi:hypothetical protein